MAKISSGTIFNNGRATHTHAKSEVWLSNQLLSEKQDKLIAGDNITIAADGKTISATGGGSTSIDDTTTSTTKVWSSNKVNIAKVGKFDFDKTKTSGSQQINIDTYLTNSGMAGTFHIYNGRDSTVNLDDLITSSITNVHYIFGGTYKNIPVNGQILCYICRHDTSTSGTYYYIFAIDQASLVTALSSTSTDAEYPSAKCVYNENVKLKKLAAAGL